MKPSQDPRRRTRRVLVEVRTIITASNGEPGEAWAPAWSTPEGVAIYLFAEILAGRALERFVAAQAIATTAVVFKFAWAPANQIDPATHRVTYDGRTFDVSGSVEDGQRQGTIVWAEAVAAAPEGGDGPS